MLKLGAHESVAGGLHKALERGVEVGCECLQIWVKNGRRWEAPPLDPAQVDAFRSAQAETGIHPIVAHAAYLINIASPDARIHRRSIRALVDELQRCAALALPYLVLHPGAHTGSGVAAGLERAAEALSAVHRATAGCPTRILLETTAGAGTEMGAKFEELAHMIAHTQEGERLGICLDTCHTFAAGYELRTAEGYTATMAALEESVGLERLKVLHLNDSQHPLGSHKDRHEHIGEGHLGEEAFQRLLQDPRLAELPGILETPKSDDLHEDKENLARLRAL